MKNFKLNIRILFVIIPLITQFILSSIYTFYAVKDYNFYLSVVHNKPNLNPILPLNSVFTYWIGGMNITNYKNVFFYLIFIGSIFPCLYFIDLYKTKKFSSKSVYCISFSVSGSFALISLLMNFISVTLFIPSIYPDSVYDIYYNVSKSDIFSDIFYSAPFLYELIYMVMISIFCGLIGCLSYGCYKLIHNHIIGYFIPVLLLLGIHIIDKKHFVNSISPINYGKIAIVSISNIKIYTIEIFILLLLTIGTFIIQKRNNID